MGFKCVRFISFESPRRPFEMLFSKQNARERISSSLSRRVSCNKRRISDRGMRNSPWLRLSYGERNGLDRSGKGDGWRESSRACDYVTTYKGLAESRIILFLSCLNSRQKRVSSSKMSNFVTRLMIVFAFSFYLYFLSLSLSPFLSLFSLCFYVLSSHTSREFICP